MQLYVGTSSQFIQDTTQNQMASKLRSAFLSYYGYAPSPGEVGAWTNSLRSMALVVSYSGLSKNGMLVEYQLPSASKRIDCILTGEDVAGNPRAVLVELKQWERCQPSEGEHVVTWVAGGERDVLHPSVQADGYRQYLLDSHTAFYEGEAVGLDACAYLHNYSYVGADTLLQPKYEPFRARAPIFSRDDVDPFRDFLVERIGSGDEGHVLQRVMQSTYRPSKKLMDHVGGVIKGNSNYVLLDEQLVVKDKILTLLRTGVHNAKKQVVIVKGGPGTGKSVIALNLAADLLLREYSTHYATGSKAFTETLRRIVGSRGSQLFRYFNSYMRTDPGTLDVLVMDESHRIRATSDNRYTPAAMRTGTPQIHELLRAAKVSVFFVDDHQCIRDNEIGRTEYIREEALTMGAVVHEFELDVQFRCGGSDAFVQWVENTLGLKRTANVLWEGAENFALRIMDSPEEVEREVRARVSGGATGRLVAGFCWPWSDPKPDGTLAPDVRIGGWQRPWNAKPDATKLAPGIPKSSLWAYDPRGLEQVGCVYTAQGFEFDYVGVLWGRDLVWDPKQARLVGVPTASADPVVKRSKASFETLVKNTYRVLLSRGLKGCFVYIDDEKTRDFVRSRLDERGRVGRPEST